MAMTDDLPPPESARTIRRDKRRRTDMVVDGAALRHRVIRKIAQQVIAEHKEALDILEEHDRS